jgi:transposase-like protein
MSEKPSRRRFTTEQKVAILRRHLVDKVPVSDLCDEYRIQPSLFYVWQRQALEHLDAAVEAGGGRRRRESKRAEAPTDRIEALEAKLARKDQVIAEISEEYVQLKKELGES